MAIQLQEHERSERLQMVPPGSLLPDSRRSQFRPSSGADGPSVLQVRCLNVMPDAIGLLVLSVLRTYESELKQGALVVVDERRERVRIPPLNRQA